MTLPAQLLLLAAVIPSTLTLTSFSCGCFFSNRNYQQYHVACRHDEDNHSSATEKEVSCGRPHFSCANDVTGYLPEGYEYGVRGRLYKLYRTAMTYDKATITCRRDGGKLAVPTSTDEAEAIANIIKNSPATKQAFVGFTDIADEGSFVTENGTPLSQLGYGQWVTGQPDNWRDAEDCVTINEQGLYNDYVCNWAQHFVCQRTVSPAPPEGYRYLPQLGFYRHYTSPSLNFADARKKCLDDGGYLAVIETLKEAEELVKFFDVDQGLTRESWVGLNDIKQEGVYASETGKTLADLAFDNWANGEPSGFASENCIVFETDGSYSDVYCDLLKSYFCEIPLPRNATT